MLNIYLFNECDKEKGNIRIIKLLVKHGIDGFHKILPSLPVIDIRGRTPFFFFHACAHDNLPIVKYFVEKNNSEHLHYLNYGREIPLFKACSQKLSSGIWWNIMSL